MTTDAKKKNFNLYVEKLPAGTLKDTFQYGIGDFISSSYLRAEEPIDRVNRTFPVTRERHVNFSAMSIRWNRSRNWLLSSR